MLQSKLGLTLALFYILVSGYLIATQGLFGESFIAIILGVPWSFFFVYLAQFVSETSPIFPVFLYVWVLAPIVLNTVALYWIGRGLERYWRRKVGASILQL